MSRLLSTPLSAHMGERVLGYLSAYAHLPERGVLAGQAVTSALLDLYGDGTRRGPINDLDVFTFNTQTQKSLKMTFTTAEGVATNKTIRLKVSSKHETADSSQGHYEAFNIPQIISRRLLDITAVSSDGLINFIALNPRLGLENLAAAARANQSRNPLISPRAVIASFDLNCVEVAIDLDSKQMYWSAAFEQFIKTAQLQVTHIHGEAHTYTRLIKKIDEMPWMYCDHEATIRCLALSSHLRSLVDLNTRTSTKSSFQDDVASAYLGKKYRERIERYSQAFERGFTLSPVNKQGTLYKATPTISLQDQRLTQLGPVVAFAQKADQKLKNGKPLSTSEKNSLLSATKWALYESPSASYRVGLVNGAAQSKRQMALQQAASRSSAEVAKRAPNAEMAALGYPTSRSESPLKLFLMTKGDAYLSGQVDVNVATRLSRFLLEHDGLAQHFAPYNYQEQVQLMKNMLALDDKYSNQFIGLVESSPLHNEYGPLSCAQDALDIDVLEKAFRPKLDSMLKPINVTPLPLQQPDNSVLVNELLTPIGIHAEGARMHHCVGGYADKVRADQCRILSLQSGPSSTQASTAEITALRVFDENGHCMLTLPIIKQHRGFANGPVPGGHNIACSQVVQKLAQTLNADEQMVAWQREMGFHVRTEAPSRAPVHSHMSAVSAVSAAYTNLQPLSPNTRLPSSSQVEKILVNLLPIDRASLILDSMGEKVMTARVLDLLREAGYRVVQTNCSSIAAVAATPPANSAQSAEAHAYGAEQASVKPFHSLAMMSLSAVLRDGSMVPALQYPVALNEAGVALWPEVPSSLIRHMSSTAQRDHNLDGLFSGNFNDEQEQTPIAHDDKLRIAVDTEEANALRMHITACIEALWVEYEGRAIERFCEPVCEPVAPSASRDPIQDQVTHEYRLVAAQLAQSARSFLHDIGSELRSQVGRRFT